MLEVCLILIGSLIIVGALCYLHKKLTGQPAAAEATTPSSVEDTDECCGLHAACEKTALNAVTQTIVYYDDDELDVYRGRPGDAYSENEIEQFRDVMLTLQSHDVAGWLLSLNQREINLPTPLHPELQLLLSDL